MLLRTRLLAAVLVTLAPLSAAHAERLFGLTTLGTIVTFDTNGVGTILSTAAISGVGAGETLLGIDFRPTNRVFYTLSSAGNLYSLARNSLGYSASLVGNTGVAVTGNVGLDFNPVADRLRAVTTGNDNLRINPASAVTLVDQAINYPGNPGLDPEIVGVAYSNNRPGAASTIEYGIDAATDSLVRFISPNAGTLQTIGSLNIAVASTDRVGFDISGLLGDAFMTRNDRLYTVNLATGAAINLGRIGGHSGPMITGITAAVVPEPATWALLIGGFGAVGASARRRRATAA